MIKWLKRLFRRKSLLKFEGFDVDTDGFFFVYIKPDGNIPIIISHPEGIPEDQAEYNLTVLLHAICNGQLKEPIFTALLSPTQKNNEMGKSIKKTLEVVLQMKENRESNQPLISPLDLRLS